MNGFWLISKLSVVSVCWPCGQRACFLPWTIFIRVSWRAVRLSSELRCCCAAGGGSNSTSVLGAAAGVDTCRRRAHVRGRRPAPEQMHSGAASARASDPLRFHFPPQLNAGASTHCTQHRPGTQPTRCAGKCTHNRECWCNKSFIAELCNDRA